MADPLPQPLAEDTATAQLRAAVAEARAALARGHSQEHEAVRAWLQALADGRREPAPGS